MKPAVSKIIALLPKGWQDFLKKAYDTFFLLKKSARTIGFSPEPWSLLFLAIKITLKENVNIVGRLDYSNAIQMDISSYRQIRGLRALKKEPETISWIESEINPGEVFYDIGANIGAYSFVAWAHTDGRCKIYAFEPSFSTFGALCKNVSLNNASKSISIFQIALGRNTELIPLNYSDITPGGALHTFGQQAPGILHGPNDHGKAFSQNILSYRMDDFIRLFNLPYPNHIKIDVDGYELDVLMGAENTFNHPDLKSVLIEIDKSLPQSQEVYNFFEKKGFMLVSKKERVLDFNCVFKRNP